MSRSFFRCVVSSLPSSEDLDSFYVFNTPRSQNRSTPKNPKSPITDAWYHLMAITLGLGAAVATIGGLAMLIYRRRSNNRVFGATTKLDKLMYLMLAITILAGTYATIFESWLGHHDYREGISIWFRQFWILQPDVSLMAAAPIGFQIHVLSAVLLFGVWPFTRLVHVFTVPLGYLTRPYIVYRSKDQLRQPQRRGWEHIDF